MHAHFLFVMPQPGEVDTWQLLRALEWVSVSQAPHKDSQGLRYLSSIRNNFQEGISSHSKHFKTY